MHTISKSVHYAGRTPSGKPCPDFESPIINVRIERKGTRNQPMLASEIPRIGEILLKDLSRFEPPIQGVSLRDLRLGIIDTYEAPGDCPGQTDKYPLSVAAVIYHATGLHMPPDDYSVLHPNGVWSPDRSIQQARTRHPK